jgi:hypothetical protein
MVAKYIHIGILLYIISHYFKILTYQHTIFIHRSSNFTYEHVPQRNVDFQKRRFYFDTVGLQSVIAGVVHMFRMTEKSEKRRSRSPGIDFMKLNFGR